MNLTSYIKRIDVNDLLQSSQFVLRFFKVKFTSLHLGRLFDAHVDYPSLLAIKDVLDEYGLHRLLCRRKVWELP